MNAGYSMREESDEHYEKFALDIYTDASFDQKNQICSTGIVICFNFQYPDCKTVQDAERQSVCDALTLAKYFDTNRVTIYNDNSNSINSFQEANQKNVSINKIDKNSNNPFHKCAHDLAIQGMRNFMDRREDDNFSGEFNDKQFKNEDILSLLKELRIKVESIMLVIQKYGAKCITEDENDCLDILEQFSIINKMNKTITMFDNNGIIKGIPLIRNINKNIALKTMQKLIRAIFTNELPAIRKTVLKILKNYNALINA